MALLYFCRRQLFFWSENFFHGVQSVWHLDWGRTFYWRDTWAARMRFLLKLAIHQLKFGGGGKTDSQLIAYFKGFQTVTEVWWSTCRGFLSPGAASQQPHSAVPLRLSLRNKQPSSSENSAATEILSFHFWRNLRLLNFPLDEQMQF